MARSVHWSATEVWTRSVLPRTLGSVDGGAAIEYRLLGPVQVLRDGQPVRLGPPKARALLAYLLLNAGIVVSAERLVDVLWDEQPPTTARHALQVYVAELRTALEPARPPGSAPAVLQTRAPGYQLAVPPDRLDVHRFESLVDLGRRHLTEGRPAPAAAVLRDAAALWRGPALADLAGMPFAAPSAQRLEELRLAAQEDRVDAELAMGRHAQLAGELAGLVREHPVRERLHDQLVVALYRCGRQSDALRVLRELRERLAEEGLVLSRRLRELEVAVLRQAPELAPPRMPEPQADVPASAPSRAAPVLIAPHLVRTVTAIHAVVTLPPASADEDVVAAWAEIPDRVARCVRQHGGTVTERAAGAVSGVFGLPESHEDDPERAVRAALSVSRELLDYGRHVAEAWDVAAPAVRIGVCSGTAGTDGDPTTAATRLAAAAEDATVLVDASTRNLVDAQFTWASAPAETSTACAPVPGPGRVRGLPDVEVALVGRERELTAARAVLDAALTGSGGLLWVTGEVGVGKTRLLTELRTYAPEGPRTALWLQGNCLSYGEGLAHWPIRELVHEWLGVPMHASQLRLRTRLRTRLDALVGPGSLDTHLGLASLLDLRTDGDLADRARQLSPEAMERVTTSALRTIVLRLAEQGPLVMAVEDAHWADASSLRMLHALLELVEDGGFALIVTQRPERDHASWGLRELALRSLAHRTTEVVLGPLPAGEDAALLTALTGTAPVDPALRRRLLDAADGNPFFLEELVRSLPGDRNRTPILELPASIEQVLASRIGQLPAGTQLLLATAAVLGTRFSVADLVGVADLDAVPAEQLRELTAHGLVVQTRGAPVAEYEFRHALIHEAAYRTLWSPRRRELHRRAAEMLTARSLPHPVAAAGALARHWQCAGDDERAMEAHRLAARAAFTVHALGVAAHHFTEGLAAGRRLGPRVDRCRLDDLLLGLGQVGRLTGAGDPEKRLTEALEGAHARGDPDTEWRARYELGFWLGYVRGRHHEARACFEAAARAAERAGDVTGQVGALSRVSLLLADELDLVGALRYADRALRLAADAGDERALASALDARKLSALFLGELAELGELVPQLDAILRRHDELWTLQFVLAESAVAAAATGRWADGEAKLAEADEVNRRCGDRNCRPFLLATRAGFERSRGDYGRALAVGAEAVAAAADGAWWEPWARTELGVTLLALGDLSAAAEHLVPAAQAAMMPAQQVRALAHLAWVHQREAAPEPAASPLHAAEALLAAMTTPHGETYLFGADAVLACASVRLARGEPDGAEALAGLVVAAAERSGWCEPLARGLLLLARIRWAGGHARAARTLAGRGLEVAERAGLPAVAWRAGAVLAGMGAPAAAGLLRRARRGVVELSASLPDVATRTSFVDAALAEVDELAHPGGRPG